MPRCTDFDSVLIIGAGPIVIGQACEFDYSGTQACRALKEEGYRVILVNSNPATIMTDPEFADATYVEPLHWQSVAEIIKNERPGALLPTMGGQTGLNCALELDRQGVLQEHGVVLIGACRESIIKAEDRDQFGKAMRRIGLTIPDSFAASSMDQAWQYRLEIDYPVIIRPSFTLGGSGAGVARNRKEFAELCEHGLELSPSHEVLLERSVLGWKEYELEVVRDRADNCIIVCSIENLDPMGLHTGDSITVTPAQTLTDKEYQRMRNAAIAILREIGVDTGGSNVQFAINPEDGQMVVIEMNPRVSRSSSLASKATGFPIARVAAKLAVGYTLDELANEITAGATPASFEPVLDYVVTKIPRFDFEKFPQADDRLTTQMKSVGEVMAIGRSFQESLQKAMRSLETGVLGLDEQIQDPKPDDLAGIRRELQAPGSNRLWYVADAFRHGMSLEEVYQDTRIDRWFLFQIQDLVKEEKLVREEGEAGLSAERMRDLKRKGFSDARLAALLRTSATWLRELRLSLGVRPSYLRVDSCAAEFATNTAYLYSSYENHCEAAVDDRRKIMILGGGPNRIGQGIEFDYCCVHAALALREEGYETIMVNCNPETVSTDYDISDRLYFEPLTLEDVLSIAELERPEGIIAQYGGQTPLKLARPLEQAGFQIIGTSPESIDLAEDRERFQQLLQRLRLQQPSNRTVRTAEQALRQARELGYPLLVRPSYVLGGRAMELVCNEQELSAYYLKTASRCLDGGPVLLDCFLQDAIEVDVDAVADGKGRLIGAVMEHIERAGIHSGDSACCLPPHSLSPAIQERLIGQVRVLAAELKVVGLINVQFAIQYPQISQDPQIYLLEVNPRASRTVPFISKATGVPLARVAARCMVGISLQRQGLSGSLQPAYYAVKEAVFPFNKLPGVDPLLGPEMFSTGEVMGIGKNFAEAFYKAAQAVHQEVPDSGLAFFSVRDVDKPEACRIGEALSAMGFCLCATRGTANALSAHGLECRMVNKVLDGPPHIVTMLQNDEICFIVNTTEGKQAIADSYTIRRTALQRNVFYTTTIAGADAMMQAIRAGGSGPVACLQQLYGIKQGEKEESERSMFADR